MVEISINNDNIFAIHGAAVEWQEKAYLFLGATTSGKTTLASYLTSNGFGYITDDCIFLNKTDFHIHPNTTPLHLRDGGVDVLRVYSVLPDSLELLDNGIDRRYVYTPKICVTETLSLERIYFIRRTDNENSIIQMNMTERITEFMKSPIVEYSLSSEYIKFISQLAKYDCHYLLYSDMNYVAEIIKSG